MRMKLNEKYWKKSNGDTRIKHRFLLFPKKIKYEIRWLEFAKGEEKFSIGYHTYEDSIFDCWTVVRWID